MCDGLTSSMAFVYSSLKDVGQPKIEYVQCNLRNDPH